MRISFKTATRGWRRPACALAMLLVLGSPVLAQDPAEIEFWKSVQDSKNPDELQAYLQAYPHGRFAPLARLRISRLTGKPAPGPAEAMPGGPSATQETPPGSAQGPAPPTARGQAPTVVPATPGEAAAPPAAAGGPETPGGAAPSLGSAIRAGDMVAVKAAVANGAEVDALDDKGMPPIGLAALLGRADIIALLTAAGADVNRNDRFGFTPLMNAAIRGQPEAARILIALGADPTLKGANGNDPLGAARPNGPADRRYEGKMAVRKILEDAIAARSGNAPASRREGNAAGPESAGAAKREALNRAGGSRAPIPVGMQSLRCPADQPKVATDAHLQDVAKSVRGSTKLSCDGPKFFHWSLPGWDEARFNRNTKGVRDTLESAGYQLSRLESPLDNLRIIRVDNPGPAQASPSLLPAFYYEDKTDLCLMAGMTGP